MMLERIREEKGDFASWGKESSKGDERFREGYVRRKKGCKGISEKAKWRHITKGEEGTRERKSTN